MTYASTTTLAAIRAKNPCQDGWAKLLAHIGKTSADDEPLSLLTVLDSNGLDDALWVLSYTMPDDRLARHFQAWCADQVLHVFEADCPDDMRVRNQIAMLRNDHATPAERKAARVAALAAAQDAAGVDAGDAAWDAARIAAGDAPWVAAWVAALSAARSAALAAAGNAALAAARDAAGDAARIAAGDAAWVAAGDAAWVAAWVAARDVARSAARSAAWDAALSVAWVAQETQLRAMIGGAA